VNPDFKRRGTKIIRKNNYFTLGKKTQHQSFRILLLDKAFLPLSVYQVFELRFNLSHSFIGLLNAWKNGWYANCKVGLNKTVI
jgi:hypothetical protein